MRAHAALVAFAAAASAATAPHKLSRFGTAASTLRVTAGYAVAVSPSANLRDGDTVRVTYSSASPSKTDLVIAYSPLPSNLSASAPVEWFSAMVDPAYLATGTGVVPARLVNMRAPYTFALATGPLAAPVARALSAPVTFADVNEPRAARLAVTGSPTEMRVSWSSAVSTKGPTVVVDGGAPLAAQSYSWGAADMCGAPATGVGFRDPGFVHTAVMTGLAPGSTHSYTVGDGSGRLGPFTFTQPAASGFPFFLSAVGDVGGDTLDGSDEEQPFPPAPNTTRLIARDVAAGVSNGVLHVGDLSYARGYEASWNFFTDLLATTNVISPVVPYHTNLGNHERDFPGSGAGPSWLSGTDSGGECGVPSAKLFPQPAPGGVVGDTVRLWWAAAIGPVFTVHFSSELDSTPGGEMWTFVRDALQSVNRSATPWVVVGTHRPLAISSTNDSPGGGDTTVAQALRANIAPLFADAGGAPVDLVLAGHHHSYQRLAGLSGGGDAPGGAGSLNVTVPCPGAGPDGRAVYKGGLAPVYLDIGTGGAGFSTNIITPQPAWACVVAFWHGFERLSFFNASTMRLQFINDLDGSISDEAWIVKD